SHDDKYYGRCPCCDDYVFHVICMNDQYDDIEYHIICEDTHDAQKINRGEPHTYPEILSINIESIREPIIKELLKMYIYYKNVDNWGQKEMCDHNEYQKNNLYIKHAIFI